MTQAKPGGGSNRKQKIGRWGESLAAEFLSAKGIEILQRNYRTPYGEIDLIGAQGEEIIFIEVKTRTNHAFGLPEEAVTPKKTDHLIQAIGHYLQSHPDFKGFWRIDVIAITGSPRQDNLEIEYFENAIS